MGVPIPQNAKCESAKLGQRFDGNGIFNSQIFRRVEVAFEGRFGHPLPVSANGETAVHRAMGFEPVGVNMSELLKAGGGPKCCTLELR